MKDTTVFFFVSATPLKPLRTYRIFFFFKGRQLHPTQRGYNVFDPSVSPETAQQNFVKLCKYEGHNVPQEILIPFFSRSYALFELRNWPK